VTNVHRWYRIARVLSESHVPVVPRAITLLIRLIFGCYIPHDAQIGAGTKFGYGGIGVVVHHDCVIGRDCTISQGVTLGGGRGGLDDQRRGVPVLGDNVMVGAGAKVLGPVHLGDGSVVGANAVVTHDVPPGMTVVGIPARPLQKHGGTSSAAR
jgi:serine O-acetyltransferase